MVRTVHLWSIWRNTSVNFRSYDKWPFVAHSAQHTLFKWVSCDKNSCSHNARRFHSEFGQSQQQCTQTICRRSRDTNNHFVWIDVIFTQVRSHTTAGRTSMRSCSNDVNIWTNLYLHRENESKFKVEYRSAIARYQMHNASTYFYMPCPAAVVSHVLEIQVAAKNEKEEEGNSVCVNRTTF